MTSPLVRFRHRRGADRDIRGGEEPGPPCGPEAVDIWREMEGTDPVVAWMIKERKSGVVRARREWDANGAPPGIVEWCRSALDGIEDFDGDLADLLDAIPWGWSVAETQLVAQGGTDGRTLWFPRKFVAHDPAGFLFDESGRLRRITDAQPVDGEPVPDAPRFFALSWNPRFENPYGSPELRPLWRAWRTKRAAARWWATSLEKHGMPFLLAKLRGRLPEEDLARIEDLLTGFSEESCGWVSGDDVEDVRFLEPARDPGTGTFLPFLEYWDRRMITCYLGSHLAVDAPPGSGNRAAAETHLTVMRGRMRSDAAWLAGKLSGRVWGPLLRMNFGYTGPVPILRMVVDD